MVWTDYSWYMYINAVGIVAAMIWFIILIIIALNKRNQMNDLNDRKWFMRVIYYKMFFSVVFALVYIYIIGGGDTLAYWEASRVMHAMFFKSPYLYFEQIFTESNWNKYYIYFNHYVGYPPSFIYREPESYFVSKVTTLLSFGTFNSYFAANLIYAYFSAMASWRLYVFARAKKIFNDKYLKIGVLFMPSVAFWCSGVSKDTLVFISSIYLILAMYQLKEGNISLKNLISLILFSFLIINTRNFIFLLILSSFGIIFVFKYLKTKKNEFFFNLFKRIIAFSIIIGTIVSISVFFAGQNLAESNELLKEAATVQEDFARNTSYGTNRYSLGTIEFTPIGLLKVMPIATIIGIYEPFIWNARSLLLVMSGFESVLMFYLTFLIFRNKIGLKFSFIRTNEFLLFCLIFSFFVGFMAGFSSIMYGVLVRIKTLLIPFIMIFLATDWDMIISKYKRAKSVKKARKQNLIVRQPWLAK